MPKLSYKMLEASREARLWLGQIIIPVVIVLACSPEARTKVTDIWNSAKCKVNNFFTKIKEGK